VPRLPSGRVALAVAAAVSLLGLLYLAARETALFAVRTVEVRGAPSGVRAAVRQAAEAWEGESLVALDGGELRRRLASLPTVRSLSYDRAFPHTLSIRVVPERPAVVARRGHEAWIVSERGRVIRAVAPDAAERLPRIWLPEGDLRAGGFISDERARVAVATASQVPERFPVRVRAVRVREGSRTLALATGSEVRLGDGTALALKLAVAARVLRSLARDERLALAYLDVTVPERPVGATDSQLSD
jgi:cell division septal protein FtsQ